MKKKTITLLTFILLVFTKLNAISAQATETELNDALGFNETVDDITEAPIHFLIGFAMLIAVYIGYNKLARAEMNKKA